MTKPRNINLKHTMLVPFLLFYVLAPLKNIATSSDRNEEPIYIITNYNENIANISWISWLARTYHIVLRTDTDTLGEFGHKRKLYNNLGFCRIIYSLLFITGSIYTSLYNYFTKHNKRKQGWYHSKFLIYFGEKTNITKNLHLDLYFSLLNFCANLFVYFIFTKDFLSLNFTEDLLLLILKIISLDINIRIYKKFYFCLNPMSFILIGLLHIKRSSMHNEITEYLLSVFPHDLPQNFNLSNICTLKYSS